MDRKSMLVALLVFGGLLVLCFGFGLALMQQDGGSSPYSGTGPRIGVVEVTGPILDTKRQLEQLEAFRRDKTIEAIVVRIDSPGGAVGPSQELYRAIQRTRASKKVVASLGAVAASGGYYAAAAADKIIASPGTITGSIGVISQVAEVSQLLDLAKVRVTTFKSGELKDSGSVMRPLTEEDRAYLQSIIEDIYRQFVRDVAVSRGIDEAEVRPVADGRVLTGEQALEHKLIDELGNLNDALVRATELAGAKGDPVPVYRRKQDLFNLVELLEETSGIVGALSEALRSVVAVDSPTRATVQLREPLIR